MQLLQPKQALQNKDKEETIKRIRTAEIQQEYEKKLRLLNNLNDDFEQALKIQRATYAEEKEAHQRWREEVSEEVGALEARKTQALAPLEGKVQEVHEGEKRFIEGMTLLDREREETEEVKEAYLRRLAEVGERETKAEQLGKSLDAREKGIEMQSASIREQSQRITKALEQLSQSGMAREDALKKRETYVQAAHDTIAIKEAQIKEREEALHEEEYRLKLYRLTLERNYKKNN